nr:hypothetical protein [Tanacetum cinerariifolium]
MADVNAPSGQTPTMAPPVRADDQILPHIRWIPIGKSNYYLDLKNTMQPNLQDRGGSPKEPQLLQGKKRATLIVIPSIRFTKMIIHHLQRRYRFHPRPDSLLHLSNEEPVLGYLKFSAKGTKSEVFRMPIPDSLITTEIQQATYYQEYLAKPAPTSAPAKSQENKRKQATETTDKLAKAKRIKHSFFRKTRQPRSSPKSVGVSEAAEEPQVADEDADYQKAVEESMKDAYVLPKGPLPSVVIRELESRKYQPLPEVPGKGKAKVTEEQVSHDLLSLQKHKETSLVDQYIFQRRVFEPTGSSGHDESPYALLGQSDNEEESEKVVLGAKEGGQDEDQAGPDPDAQAKDQMGSDAGAQADGQARSNPDETFEGQAGSNPNKTSKGQAGPDPGDAKAKAQSISSLVVHAGSDREHMDLDVANRIGKLEHIMADLIQVNKNIEERDLSEADMKEILHQRMWESDSYKSHEDHMQLFEALEKSINRDHSKELTQELAEARKKKKKSSAAPSPSKTAASAEYQAWTTTDIRLRPSISLTPVDLEMDEDMAPDEQAQLLDDEDIRSAHIPIVNLRQGWWKPFEEERPTTPKPAWSIRSSDVPVATNNWASALASNYSPPPEDSLLAQTGDIATFIDCKGHRPALSISKMKVAYYPDAGLEQMVPDQFWIEEECKYDIAAMYGISHWWFQRQRFYIDRHTSEGDRSARVEDFQLGIESYQTQVNLTKPQWTAMGFEYKHDYTVIKFPRAVIFQDKYEVQMMMRFNEIHKFNDGTLLQIDEALDYRVKEFRINKLNPGLNTRFWTRKDVDRCNAFMFAIQRRLRTRRIFRNLESFVGGGLVDIEKVAVCSSLRSPKSKRTIESRAKGSSKIISLGYDSTLLASSHTVKSKTDIKSPTHYPCGLLLLPPPYHQYTSSSSGTQYNMTRKLEATGHTTGKKRATLIVIPSIRFTKLIIHHLQRRHKFHPRPDSSLHLSNEEPVLGYLKFSAKGSKREVFRMPIPGSLITSDIQTASYYQEYLASVAKHKKYLAGKTGSHLDSPAPMPTKPARKPKSIAPKAPPRPSVSISVTSAQPAPTSASAKPQEKKRKKATETSDKPPKAKKSKYRWVSKKRTLKHVATSEAEDVPIM